MNRKDLNTLAKTFSLLKNHIKIATHGRAKASCNILNN